MTTERELIQRAQRGDTQAFTELVQTHAPYVYNVALKMLADPHEAEDMAQEAFVQVWKALPRFRGQAKFRTWLYRIVTNVCFGRLPKLKRELNQLETDAANDLRDEAVSVERDVIQGELRDRLHEAIAALPDSYRLLITLRHLQGMSYGEIALVTDMPLGSVKTGIFRARRQLRLALERV